MNKNILVWILAIILIVPTAMALDTSYLAGKNQPFDLRVPCFDTNNDPCDAGTTCSLTVTKPDNSVLVDYTSMSRNSNYYNYSFTEDQLNQTGYYGCTMHCLGANSGFSTFSFEVTPTGQDKPGGGAIVFFSIGFLIVMGWMIFTILNTITHFAKLDFDMKDLLFSWIGYFTVIGLYYLSKVYLGNDMVNDFGLLWIRIGAITHGIIPAFALGASMIVNYLKAIRRVRGEDDDF